MTKFAVALKEALDEWFDDLSHTDISKKEYVWLQGVIHTKVHK